MPDNFLSLSYTACRRITRRHARSFYFASHTLPSPKRASAYAIYSFCRHVDDAIDLAQDPAARAAAFAGLRQLTSRLFEKSVAPAPDPALPWAVAFQDTARRCKIPQTYFLDLLTGVEMDQSRVRFTTWEELRQYCYHVASVVGLMMVHVLAEPREELLAPAIDLGLAMQLTNILRDVKEDYKRDRIYFPEEEMRQFGVSEDDFARERVSENWRAFMRYQIGRARNYYGMSERGIRLLPQDGSQMTVWLMRTIYAGILDELERADFQVFRGRVFVSTPRKFWLATRAWQQNRRSVRRPAAPVAA
jgi:phytoene synthase